LLLLKLVVFLGLVYLVLVVLAHAIKTVDCRSGLLLSIVHVDSCSHCGSPGLACFGLGHIG
jgi:hypothetical protein